MDNHNLELDGLGQMHRCLWYLQSFLWSCGTIVRAWLYSKHLSGIFVVRLEDLVKKECTVIYVAYM